MDGVVETGWVGAALAMACPKGASVGGALSLVPFFGQAKKGTRPRAMRAVRSTPLEAGETACRPVRLLLAAS